MDKSGGLSQPLPSPVVRIFYMSSEGTQREHEVQPDPNPKMLEAIHAADAIVYGMGSLFTSICPALVLQVSPLASMLFQQVPAPGIHANGYTFRCCTAFFCIVCTPSLPVE